MKLFLNLKSLIAIAPILGANAFLFPEPMKIRAGLADIVDRQPDLNLKVLLNIGNEKDASKFAIRNMEFGLKTNKPEYEHVKLVRTSHFRRFDS